MRNNYKTKVIGMLDIPGSHEIARRIYSPEGVCPCLNRHSSDTVPKVLLKFERKKSNVSI